MEYYDGNNLSIPQWSDFNCVYSHRHKHRTIFQSHNGLILTIQAKERWCIMTYLSIPQWSDFNAPPTAPATSPAPPFNPTMV